MTRAVTAGIDRALGPDRTAIVLMEVEMLRVLSDLLMPEFCASRRTWPGRRLHEKTGRHNRTASARGRKRALHGGRMRHSAKLKFRRCAANPPMARKEP